LSDGLRVRTGLVLTGGGARAAYQVGVLKAISEILGHPEVNPFGVLCGTSAGAINATALAARIDHFAAGVDWLLDTWRGFHAHHVYRTDRPAVMRSGARWLGAMMLVYRRNPISLLDNSPLATLLAREVDFDRIRANIAAGALHALSITMSGYSSGASVTFYETAGTRSDWDRPQRVGRAAKLMLEHLLASSALPFIFPAVKLGREYFGDGSMRQIAPISPALHLGADRVLVVGTGRQTQDPARVRQNVYPTMAAIAGHALNSIFLDSLAQDIEWLQRINETVKLVPPEIRAQHGIVFRHVQALVISPSEPIERIAARHLYELPRTIRFMMRPVGAMNRSGANLASYLLFEPGFTHALIELGFADTLARRAEVIAFLGGES
jgi:NTE family protein